LCGSCQKSYGLSFRFQCFSCPRRFASLLTLLGLTLYLFVSSATTIRGTLPSPSSNQKPTQGEMKNGPSTSSQHDEVRVEIDESLPQDLNKDEESGTKSKSIVIRSPCSKPMHRYELLRWKTIEILKVCVNAILSIVILFRS